MAYSKRSIVNRYPIKCRYCGAMVPAGAGKTWTYQGRRFGAHLRGQCPEFADTEVKFPEKPVFAPNGARFTVASVRDLLNSEDSRIANRAVREGILHLDFLTASGRDGLGVSGSKLSEASRKAAYWVRRTGKLYGAPFRKAHADCVKFAKSIKLVANGSVEGDPEAAKLS